MTRTMCPTSDALTLVQTPAYMRVDFKFILGAGAPKTSSINKNIQTLKHYRYPPIWKMDRHAQTRLLERRGCALHSAAARVCGEGGVSTNVFLRDLNLAAPNAADGKRVEDGLPLFGGTQLAIDTSLGSACIATVALVVVHSQLPRCLGGAGPERADIVGGGRYFPETVSFFRSLADAHARGKPPLLEKRAGRAGSAAALVLHCFLRCWTLPFLESLSATGSDGVPPSPRDVELEERYAGLTEACMELGGSVVEKLLASPHSLHAVPRTCRCASCPVKDERAEQTTAPPESPRRERRGRRNKRTRNSFGKAPGDAQERKTQLGQQRQRFVSAAGFFVTCDSRHQGMVTENCVTSKQLRTAVDA